ncbi:oxidoreductase [uncultured Campylobacter sp.]|uniref:oxidoreductase n=1 Tax=uncultured Campylobacter sp. TaxID=218934 RepID=UPI002611FD7A|nr:oxidoreductase [uncultured Campylobacter sp.]
MKFNQRSKNEKNGFGRGRDGSGRVRDRARALRNQNYDKIVVWARRELKFSHEKLEVQIVNLDKIKEIEPCDIDEIFCALGTTMKQAGSRGQFYKVDVSYPVNTAKWGIAAGARRFVLISAYGADERSRFFYMRAKGKAEKKIAELGFESLQIARLPAIKSERNELRLSELFTIWLFGLLPKGILTNYRPMSAQKYRRRRHRRRANVEQRRANLSSKRVCVAARI